MITGPNGGTFQGQAAGIPGRAFNATGPNGRSVDHAKNRNRATTQATNLAGQSVMFQRNPGLGIVPGPNVTFA